MMKILGKDGYPACADDFSPQMGPIVARLLERADAVQVKNSVMVVFVGESIISCAMTHQQSLPDLVSIQHSKHRRALQLKVLPDGRLRELKVPAKPSFLKGEAREGPVMPEMVFSDACWPEERPDAIRRCGRWVFGVPDPDGAWCPQGMREPDDLAA